MDNESRKNKCYCREEHGLVSPDLDGLGRGKHQKGFLEKETVKLGLTNEQ